MPKGLKRGECPPECPVRSLADGGQRARQRGAIRGARQRDLTGEGDGGNTVRVPARGADDKGRG
eukprot:11224032-Lingulodinium_polyedra.AAC.1